MSAAGRDEQHGREHADRAAIGVNQGESFAMDGRYAGVERDAEQGAEQDRVEQAGEQGPVLVALEDRRRHEAPQCVPCSGKACGQPRLRLAGESLTASPAPLKRALWHDLARARC